MASSASETWQQAEPFFALWPGNRGFQQREAVIFVEAPRTKGSSVLRFAGASTVSGNARFLAVVWVFPEKQEHIVRATWKLLWDYSPPQADRIW